MDEIAAITQRLFARTTHGIKLGLDRMRSAAARHGDPQNAYECFHVAGTNGKGSTCAYIESVLRSQGMRTGLFTSPHIVAFEERFAIDGRPIAGGAWVEVYRDLESTIEELGLTFFEAATLIAFELFKREKVEVAVLETGMGGRLDSTNIVTPRVCAITTIAMDHMNFLGPDLVSIASEKLGIVKNGAPCVMALPESDAVRLLAERTCREKGARLWFADPKSDASDVMPSEKGISFTYNSLRFSLPLAGVHQVQNALVAIKTLEAAAITDLAEISSGIAKTFLPGRFQVETINGKTVVFDVGHNPDAARVGMEILARGFSEKKVCLIVGIMKDKDIAGMFELYCKRANKLILTVPQGERSATTPLLRSNVPSWFSGEVHEIADIPSAIRAAFSSTESIICVLGSFFTVGEAMAYLGVKPYG